MTVDRMASQAYCSLPYFTYWEVTMRIASLSAVGAIGLMLLLANGSAVVAAEINVMAGNALAGVIGELGPNFERATGHKLVARYGLSSNV